MKFYLDCVTPSHDTIMYFVHKSRVEFVEKIKKKKKKKKQT